MKNLQHFTPAEAFLILYPTKSSKGDLLKATFFDLLMKGLLRTHLETKQVRRERPRTLKYFIADSSLPTYKFLPHEGVYLSPYLKNNRLKVMMNSLVKIGMENSNSEHWYKWNALIEQPRMSPFFKTSPILKFFRLTRLNEEGTAMQKNLLKEIADVERELAELKDTNKLQAANLVSKIGGCVILLENFESDILNEIDANVKAEYDAMTRVQDASSCSSSWDSFDSGCSSCSGCGGCGGCS